MMHPLASSRMRCINRRTEDNSDDEKMIKYSNSRRKCPTSATDNRHPIAKTMISFDYFICSRGSRLKLPPSMAIVLIVLQLATLACLLASPAIVQATTIANHENNARFSEQQPAAASRKQQVSALNYLLYSSGGQQQQQTDDFAADAGADGHTKLEFRAARQLQLEQQQQQQQQLLKDINHNHISDRVNLSLANSIWQQMHQNVRNFAHDRSELARPIVNRLFEQANVSSNCRQSINDIIDRLEQLDDWAVRMYNSFGDFPANGFFEGTHTSMGDYHQCVNLEPNQWIGQAQYCTFKFQPIIPKRPRYHNILATIDNLANFTSKEDMFHGLAKKAHYFYYTKLRLATCMPSKCEKTDLDSLGEQIAINTYLQFQGTSCLARSAGFEPDGAQIFALTILLLLASVSVLGTIVHLFDLRSLVAERRGLITISTTTTTTTNNDLSLQQQNLVALHQQQSLLMAPSQQKSSSILATGPVVVAATAGMQTPSANRHHRDCYDTDDSSSGRARLIRTMDILMHFSIVKNAKKLFDTSTSRRGGSPLIPASAAMMKESARSPPVVMVQCGDGSPPNGVGGGDGSQSDSSSVDGQTNDISCVHGLRFWTISWIILGHTMQYTEWAGFGRAYQVEQNITSFLLHPLLNATFSVDTFFLISGLLTTYVTWTITRGHYWRFNKFAFLISRYLRLMPQVLLVILIFIAFPLMGDGPYWKGLIQKESDKCKKNWWVSALFLQSFFRKDQICNLVTWWLSIEMFYHFVSIFVIIALLHSARKGILTAVFLGGSMTLYSCYLHYINHYPPNMLPTLLQRYEIWDSIVLKYFWTPYPHAPSYFTGLLLGYALYNRSISQLSRRQVKYGWLAFAVCYLGILFGTYHWNNNAPYSRSVATIYYNVSQVLWSLATGWAILACALGNGGWLNSFLSSSIFVPLGRATYMTYLSHMIIVMAYPAKMNLLIEPSYIVFLYIFIANLFLSYALGIFLTLVYESPILHLQKLLVAKMANRFNEEKRPQANCNTKNSSDDQRKVVRVS